jgi:hypothetical protein
MTDNQKKDPLIKDLIKTMEEKADKDDIIGTGKSIYKSNDQNMEILVNG